MIYNSYMLTEQRVDKVYFETLANSIRWNIVCTLREGPKRVGKIVADVEAEQSLVSHHLHRLRECGFVEVKADGRARIYTLNSEAMRPLFALVNEHIETYCQDCTIGCKPSS